MIISKAPLRLGLSGGGTDIAPFCFENGGKVLNITINQYAYTTINESDNVSFESLDLNIIESLNDVNKLLLHKETYLYFIKNFNNNEHLNIKIKTLCEALPGSGLGSSSAIVVSMVKAFDKLLSIGLDNYQISEISYDIERNICGFDGGYQDQYAAAFGGLNYLEFKKDGYVIVNQLKCKQETLDELESMMILYFCGISRDSEKIIKSQKNELSSRKTSLDAMKSLITESEKFKDSILKGDIEYLLEVFKNGWELKKKTSGLVSNKKIEDAFESAIDNGALCGKVSGAGGGGFILFFCPLDKKTAVENKLNDTDGKVVKCKFVNKGAFAWESNL